MHFARLSFLVEVQRLDGPLLFGLVAAGAPPGVAGMLGQRPSAAICADAGSGGVVSEGPLVSTTSLYRAHASVALADSKFIEALFLNSYFIHDCNRRYITDPDTLRLQIAALENMR